MIAVGYVLADFKGSAADGNSLVFEVSEAGGLPVLSYVDVRGESVSMVFNTGTRLTGAQKRALDGVVSRHDAARSYLQQQQAAMGFLVAEHAKTLRAGSGNAERSWLAKAFTSGPAQADAGVAAVRDQVLAAIDDAPTPEAAVVIAERYLGRTL